MVDRNSKAATKTCIGAHQDNENGWVKGTGFATLAFGCERPFVIREIATKDRRKLFISQGDDRITVSYEFLLHASSSIVLDQYSKALRDERWISLKFREIEEFVCVRVLKKAFRKNTFLSFK